MNPKPSLYQCLVLHEIDDGRVFQRIDEAWGLLAWWNTGSHRDHKVTRQVEKLLELGMIDQVGDVLAVTAAGHEVLKRRPLHDLLEQLNRR